MGTLRASYTVGPMAIARDIRRLRGRWQLRRERNFRRNAFRDAVTGLLGQLYVDRGGGPEATTFVAGHDRSGTTWIAEIINHARGYRYMFEPFSPGRLDITEGFRPRQYLRPTERDPHYVHAAETIVSGRVRSLWVDKYNRALVPRKRLIKEVRSNLLLPWLHALFPAMRMVFVLRHPFAVAESQLKVSRQWKANPSLFLDQDALVEDHLGPFLDAAAAVDTEFGRHVLVWCMDNYVPLQTLRGEGVHVVFYEHLVADPAGEIRRLLSYLDEPFDDGALRAAGRPSATTRRDSAVHSGGELIDGWRADVTEDQISSSVEILRLFGLDRIYDVGSMPLIRDPLRP